MANLSFSLFFTMCIVLVCGQPLLTINSKDEGIIVDGDHVRCGSLTCPTDSTGCIFQKRNNPENPQLVDVMRRCVDKNGLKTAETFDQYKAEPGQYVNTFINTGTQGGNNVIVFEELDTEKQAEILQHIEQVNANVQTTINEAMRNLNRQLKQLDQALRITF